jgi:ubiquitin carboxyl-terminal hydrolase L5
MGDNSGWCTIESDPGVFTELIEKIGVKGVQVEELWALEKDALEALKPVYGLIFLFKYVREEEKRTVLSDGAPGVFFAKQVINNACATQAIVSVLLNRPDIQLNGAVKDFADFAVALDPETRGLVLGQSETIQRAHNSFRRPEPFVMEAVEAKEDDDVFHFIGYVPKDGALYELDGLKKGPILLGDCTMENWLEKVTPHIQERMARYQGGVKFNLMALVQDRREVIGEELKSLAAKKSSASGDELSALEAQEAKLKGDLQAEKDKREKWRVENLRRKHNYIPFVFALLKKLAKEGKLAALQEEGKKKKQKRVEEAKKSKEKEAAAKK